jgi:hypothetical protein
VPEDASGGTLNAAELGMTVFENIVPQAIVDEINAAIDLTRSHWPAAHGGPGLPVAEACANLLRGNKAFRSIEQQACNDVKAWMRQRSGPPFAEDSLASLRCINNSMAWQSHLRHFDSHLLTLVVPLKTANSAEPNGDLLLYVKRRHYASRLRNLLHKAWLVLQQNRRFEVRERRTLADLATGRCRRIACVPGNVYAFNGFATLHANLDVARGERRTLVLQYFDTKATVGIKSVTPTLNGWRERVMRWVTLVD